MENKSINISDNYPTLFISDSNPSKEAQTYAVSQKNFVNIINVLAHKITPTQIIEIVDACNIDIDTLFDHSYEGFREKVKDTSRFSKSDLATMLSENPDLFRLPFIVQGNRFKFYETHKDLVG